jgi:hypothetical protein
MGRDHDADDLVARLSGREVGSDALIHGELATLVAAEWKGGAGAALLEGHKGDKDEPAIAGDAAELNDDDQSIGTLSDAGTVPGSTDENVATAGATEQQNHGEKKDYKPFHNTNPAN